MENYLCAFAETGLLEPESIGVKRFFGASLIRGLTQIPTAVCVGVRLNKPHRVLLVKEEHVTQFNRVTHCSGATSREKSGLMEDKTTNDLPALSSS